jgi:hypothetical protein
MQPNPAFASATALRLTTDLPAARPPRTTCCVNSAVSATVAARGPTRRGMLSSAALLAAAAALRPGSALAAMYSADTAADKRYQAAAKPGATLAELMVQIDDGYAALAGLQRDWALKTAALDGDVIRRVIGTVGVSSPLFNIRKTFLRAWQIIAESGECDEEQIDRLETAWNLVLDGISSVDFQSYSIGFTELMETKLSLVEKSKASLDNTVEAYKTFLDGVPKSLL